MLTNSKAKIEVPSHWRAGPFYVRFGHQSKAVAQSFDMA
jgi:hypothetical protein